MDKKVAFGTTTEQLLSTLFGLAVESGHCVTGSNFADLIPQFTYQGGPCPRIADGGSIASLREQKHLMPRCIHSIGDDGDPSDIVWNSEIRAADTGKYPQISCRRKIGARKTSIPDL